ncbi:MAG: NAD(P)/FAD-dependent oxidoreductase [Acidimicrobiales bacterium]
MTPAAGLAADGTTADGTVVVVGASLAGWRAVETLRREGFEGTISLVGEERHLPYDRPPLSKQVLAGTWPPEKAVLADKRRSSELRVHEVLGRRAVRLDVEGRKVELEDGAVLDGDAIVIATGAIPRQFPGTEDLSQRDGLFTLRTLDDSIALRRAVTAFEAPRVVVIGAGFIGAEVASTCAGLGCRVTVLEALDIPLRNVIGPLLGAYCGSLHGANGVELRSGIAVQGVRRGPADAADVALGVAASGLVVDLAGGEALPADVVVVGIGVVPATGWLADSGLALQNGVVCDDRLFAADGIVAAGDIARWNWRHDGGEELIRIEHWQVAAEAGVAAARSLMAGREEAAPFDPVPYFWSDQFGIRLQVLGNPGGDDEVLVTEGSLDEGKFVALFGRAGRLRAVMAIGKPRQLMGFRALLQAGASWDDALAHGAS